MGFFKRILGGSKQWGQEKQLERILSAASKVVNDYGAFMQSPAFPVPGCIADTKKLPHDKQIIKAALLLTMKSCDEPKMKEMLKLAYTGLADFQDGVGDADIGLDMRKLPDLKDIDFGDKAKLESIAKQMDSMMGAYKKFEKIVAEERRLLQEEVAQI